MNLTAANAYDDARIPRLQQYLDRIQAQRLRVYALQTHHQHRCTENHAC